MSELVPHNPELEGKNINLICDPEFVDDIEYFADQLGQSEADFLVNAVDFMLLRHAVYKSNAVLEAVHPNGFDVEPAANLDNMYPYSPNPESEENGEITLSFSGTQMQSVMLGCAHFYPHEMEHVSQDFGQWRQVSGRVYTALTVGAAQYMSRLEAEKNGWRFRINDNSGAALPELEPIGENIHE